MKLTMFVAAVAVANVRGHGGVNRDFVRKEKLSKHQPHLKSVTDRPQGACGKEFIAECDISVKDAQGTWEQHPCWLSEKDGPAIPIRIRRGGTICLTADHGGHVNDIQGAGRNSGDTQGIEVYMHGSECPSLSQFKDYVVAQAPFETYTLEDGLPVTIPAELEEGKYTMLWRWSWPEQHEFTSCLDVIVDDATGVSEQCLGTFTPTTNLKKKPCPRDATHVPKIYTCDLIREEVNNCGVQPSIPSAKPTTPITSTTPTTSATPTTPLTTPTSSTSSTKPTPQAAASCGDVFCQSIPGYDGSYCKHSQTIPVCHGSDVPCTPCEKDNTHVHHSPHVSTPPSESTHTHHPPPLSQPPSESTSSLCGDDLCVSIDPSSWCKYEQNPSVCRGSDVPCGCS